MMPFRKKDCDRTEIFKTFGFVNISSTLAVLVKFYHFVNYQFQQLGNRYQIFKVIKIKVITFKVINFN